ncbi:metal ABC transporter solute-binding protein, Zn/Mn family [Streptomyces sp. NPDC088674]|uniref:metal ABC transporter solute-binding protein, Zn/Mn family n=1 Tax=Streptomyces sp. NPDC088674 TaxID=3365869 RepID=UPI00380671B0
MPVRTARSLAVLISGASLLAVAACGNSSDSGTSSDSKGAAKPAASGGSAAPVTVAASTNVYGDIVKSVGGDKVEVTSFISDPDQDPHSYEADTRNQLVLSKAKLVVENGGGYDDFMDRMLKSAGNSSAEVLNAVKISGRTAPPGGELNEHVWYDLPSVAKLADRIAAALGKAVPAEADTFTSNAEKFKADLKPLEDKEAALKKAHGGEAIGITEPVPLYMTEAAGLVNKTPEDFSEAIEEGDDVSPKVLQETLALYKDKKVKALVYNSQTSGPQTEKVADAAKGAGVPEVPVTETLPQGKDYLAWMGATLDSLADALGK